MLLSGKSSGADKAARLRQAISERTVAMPGSFNAPVAMLCERVGFEAIYISGAGLINGTGGFPDIALLGMEEVVRQAGYIANAVEVPAVCDADTGFGDALQVMRTVRAFEAAGIAGIHLEDQQMPKRCGHLDGKTLVPVADMERKIAAAVEARQNPDFMIIARIDARAVEGFDSAVERGHRYLAAGADALFPEALESREEFGHFAELAEAPLLANMTEFGKSPALSVAELAELGYRMVIFPMTAFRVMMKAVEEVLREIGSRGTPAAFLERMQSRQELYELLDYAGYAKTDETLAARFPRT